MSKVWTYPIQTTITESDGTVIRIITQLYKIGLYVAFYISGDSIPQQTQQKPATFAKKIKSDIAKAKDRGAKVETTREIRVTEDKDGFYVETE